MTRILFVCLGNICRSPMAEFAMKELVREAGLEDKYFIESAATSSEEIGNPVYPPAVRKLAEHGIDCSGKRARRMRKSDYDDFDFLIGMEKANIRSMLRITGGDPEGKIRLLLEFAGSGRDIPDPWYTGDFESTWKDVSKGCRGLLHLIEGTNIL